MLENAWFVNISEVSYGGSSVLGGHLGLFYAIHATALTLICTSTVSCLIVITFIIKERGKRLEFADRFPLYLAIADLLWGASHFVDHIVLVTTQKYPEKTASDLLSINTWTFLGYQQLIHAGLAFYTYFRVVHGKKLMLGRWEWKLHLICVALLLTSFCVLFPLGSFGPNGYWMCADIRRTEGHVLIIYISAFTSIQGLTTLFGYLAIMRVVQKQRKKMRGKSLTKTKALNTFIVVSLCLYIPFAMSSLTLAIYAIGYQLVDPTSSLLIIITANSSGWANAIGYFYNRREKLRRKEEDGKKSESTGTSSQC